jgi:hypothetical protein
VVHAGHLPIVPGDRDRIPTRFGDNATISGITSPINVGALLEVLGFGDCYCPPPAACGRAHSTASSLSLSFLLALQMELPHFRSQQGAFGTIGREGIGRLALWGRNRWAGRANWVELNSTNHQRLLVAKPMSDAWMNPRLDETDYSVVVKNRAPLPNSWRWEIYRAGRASPIGQSPIFLRTIEACRQYLFACSALGRGCVPSPRLQRPNCSLVYRHSPVVRAITRACPC